MTTETRKLSFPDGTETLLHKSTDEFTHVVATVPLSKEELTTAIEGRIQELEAYRDTMAERWKRDDGIEETVIVIPASQRARLFEVTEAIADFYDDLERLEEGILPESGTARREFGGCEKYTVVELAHSAEEAEKMIREMPYHRHVAHQVFAIP